MSHTQLSQSKSRRDLAGSLRGSRTRKHARLRHRRLQAERLEDRRLLAGDFELSSLLPANGGDGTSGFVIDGITDRGKIGGSSYGSQQLGDVNQDGIDDFYLAAPGVYGTINTLSQSYIIFGRAEWQGSFPAELDLGTLTTLNGTSRSGYVIDGVVPGDLAGSAGGGAGDINGDGISDIISGARFNESYRSLVLFGGSENLAALDLADGDSDGHIELSTFDTAPDVTHGFAINGSGGIQGVGDVNGDQVDDWEVSNGVLGWFVVYGRDSTQGNFFPAVFEPSSLLSSNGGDGSNGFVIPRVAPTYMMFGSVRNAGDVNNDGIGDIIYAEPQAMPLGRSEAGQAWVIFGQTSFPATFDLASLNGSNGFTVYGKTYDGLGMWRGGTAGDVNGDSVDDLVIPAWGIDGLGGSNVGGAYVLFGKDTSTAGPFSAVLEVSALNGSNGLVMYGVTAGDYAGFASAAGDVNGDGYDDVIIPGADQAYIVYGRPSFGASLELASLLAANGGDGSAGYVLNGASSNVAGIGDINHDGFADVRIALPYADSNGLTDNGQVYVVYGKPSTPVATKFYVVNDATQNLTYEYNVSGMSVESYSLNTGNTTPRGAASTIAGDKTWVVDANRKVYVYNNSGGLLGSWTAGSLNTKATVEGIATNGTDVWIVDANSDKVYKYTGAASRLSGSQNAASSFNLNSSNKSPKDIVTDGVNLWVVNDSTTDKVFKYTTAGALNSSWTISTAGATSPTGITIDPANVSNIWIVDSGTDRVYQYNAAATFANGSSHAADVAFALAVGNTNPQGIADPPAPSLELVPASTAVGGSDSPTWDAGCLGSSLRAPRLFGSSHDGWGLEDSTPATPLILSEPLKKFRVDTARRSESRAVESHTPDLSYTVVASALAEPVAHCITDDSVANDNHQAKVDDLFAQWETDPLQLLSLPDLGM